MCGRFDDPDETETEEYFQKLERKMRKFTFEPRLSEQREREEADTLEKKPVISCEGK